MIIELSTGIRRERKFSDMITALRGATEASDFKAFDTIKDILSFSAFYAFEKGLHPRDLDVSGGLEDITAEVYRKDDVNYNAIAALALAATNDITILKKERQRDMINVFERYANAGLHEIYRIYLENDQYVFSVIKILIDQLITEDVTPPESTRPRITF